MSHIVELKTRPARVTASVIERLEEVLVKARAGEISAVGIATVEVDGAVGHSWSETDSHWKLIGAVAQLQHRMHVSRDCTCD